MSQPLEIYLPEPESSRDFGRKLGRALIEAFEEKPAGSRLQWPASFLITLSGDLGAGKTTLCQGLGQALGVDQPGEIVSPTFTLANEYRGRRDIFHLDLYRLENTDQFYEAGLDEYLDRPGICLVEWPEKMPDSLWPPDRLALSLEIKGQGRLLSAPPHPLWSFLPLTDPKGATP